MDRSVDQVLQHLPQAEDEDEGVFFLNGHLLRAGPGHVRIVVKDLFLDIDVRDVVHIEERGESNRYAIPVQIVVRQGFAVHAIGSSEPYESLLERGPVPFAVLTRADVHDVRDRRTDFHLRERRFLERYGLTSLAET